MDGNKNDGKPSPRSKHKRTSPVTAPKDLPKITKPKRPARTKTTSKKDNPPAEQEIPSPRTWSFPECLFECESPPSEPDDDDDAPLTDSQKRSQLLQGFLQSDFFGKPFLPGVIVMSTAAAKTDGDETPKDDKKQPTSSFFTTPPAVTFRKRAVKHVPATNVLKVKVAQLERELIDYQKNSHESQNMTLRERILLSSASLATKSVLFRKLREAYGQPGNSPEVFVMHSAILMTSSETVKILAWIENALEYPHGVIKPIALKGLTLDSPDGSGPREVGLLSHLRWLKSSLDEHVFGHTAVKQSIITYVARMLFNPDVPAKARLVMCLHGSPGTGKTRMVRLGIAQGLGIPMSCISLGGMVDSNMLTGQSSTYVGAKYGALVAGIVAAKQQNCVIFLDEVDKIRAHNAPEISGVLVHALDPESNSSWDGDHYMSPLHLDLSHVIFVLACNDVEKVNAIALDRMYVVHVEDASFEEKCVITKKHVIPEALVDFQIEPSQILIRDEAVEYVVRNIAQEDAGSGMRQVKRAISLIIERLLLLLISLRKNNGNVQKSHQELKELGFDFGVLNESIWRRDNTFDIDAECIKSLWDSITLNNVKQSTTSHGHMYS